MYSPHRRPIDRVVSWPALPSRVSLCVNYFLVKIFSASKVVYAKAYWPTFRVISLLDLRSRHGAMFCHPPRACGVASHEGVFSCLRADVSYFLCRATKEIGDVCTQAKFLGELVFLWGEMKNELQTPAWEARAWSNLSYLTYL